MFNILKTRFLQGHRTIAYPKTDPVMPARFRGVPVVDASKCAEGCRDCEAACPLEAIRAGDAGVTLDLGRCLFCAACMDACPEGAISYTQNFKCAARKREDLIIKPGQELALAKALDGKMKALFGRSLKLRQVSAGGCNGCELEVNVLNTVVYDLGRFGIQFVASPRHADGILITGPVTENMKLALKKTYEAVPSPKIVIAVGACAISGGPFLDFPETHNGAGGEVPIDLYIPGCSPHPLTILNGLLRLLGRIKI